MKVLAQVEVARVRQRQQDVRTLHENTKGLPLFKCHLGMAIFHIATTGACRMNQNRS